MNTGYSGRVCEPKTLAGDGCAGRSLDQAIDAVIERFPDRVALSYKSISLTYRELDVAASEMAQLLSSKGIEPGNSVVILMYRSEKMIVSLLAILRLGACYVPIDPNYPRDRIDFILKETGASALILGQTSKYDARNIGIPVVMENAVPPHSDSSRLATDIDPVTAINRQYKTGDLAYIIYTSGSTGQPKGVQVSHDNVHNYAYWSRHEFAMTESDVVDFSSTLAFDISVRATIVPLLAGAQIQICCEEDKALPHRYMAYLQENDISLMTVTPSYFGLLTKLLGSQSTGLKLKTIWLIGETSVPSDVKAWLDCFPLQQIINEYGPTEATVGILSYRIQHSDLCLHQSNIPVGTPAYNTTIYILNDEGEICPDGTPGQICIAGKSVSQGYLNRPELNAAVFSNNPYAPSETLYKTGDLGRMLDNGNIEHLGRSDRQIKVRGFRIEPGEIEAALIEHNAVDFAAVLPWESSKDVKLAAYILLVTGMTAGVFELRQHLQKRLPDYMLPSDFVYLDRVPLTLNGKLDRSALPMPGELAQKMENVPAVDEIEEMVLKTWQSVLTNRCFGVTDNFFLLGGESLSAAQIVRMLEKQFSITLSLQDFYNYTSVRNLSGFVRMKEVNAILQQDALLSALMEVESMSTAEINEQLEK